MPKVYLREKVWYGDYWQGGKRIRKPLSENKRTAQDMLDDIVAARRAMKSGLVPRDISWEGFKERHKIYAETEKEEATAYQDGLAFRRLEDAVPIKRLTDVTPELLAYAVAKWKKADLGQAYIWQTVKSIKAAMHRAEEWKLIAVQNWRIVKATQPKGRIIYYTMDEYRNLLKKCHGRWLTAALLMGRAGLRSGEARHLHFEDILWDQQLLWIRSKPCEECRSCIARGNMWRPKGWKPDIAKERHIDMPIDLQAHLEGLPNRTGLVLGPNMLSMAVYDVYFRKLIRKANLKGSAHCLRHTYASHLISNGCTLEEVGDLLGHSDPESTKIYAHMMPHARRKAVDRLPPIVADLCLVPSSSNGIERNGKDQYLRRKNEKNEVYDGGNGLPRR